MEIELFKKTYLPTMMKIVNEYAKDKSYQIQRTLVSGNHHQLLQAKDEIDKLAEARMLLESYEGCDICFSPDCQSDHK